MLGSFKVVWVGGRTVGGALFALFVLNFTRNLGMGLTGIETPKFCHLFPSIAACFKGDVRLSGSTL